MLCVSARGGRPVRGVALRVAAVAPTVDVVSLQGQQGAPRVVLVNYLHLGRATWDRTPHWRYQLNALRAVGAQSSCLTPSLSSSSSSGAAAAFGWDVEVWHERLLAGAAAGKGTARVTSRSAAT